MKLVDFDADLVYYKNRDFKTSFTILSLYFSLN